MSLAPAPRALMWDMDGTLIDSEPLHEEALVRALETLHLPVPEGLHAQVIGMGADAVYDWLAATVGLTLPFAEWIVIKYRAYMTGVSTLQAYEDALETWHWATAQGLRQAVASNSDRMIVEANLGHIALTRPGLVTVSRNDILRGKPDPEIYLRAAYLLGVRPEEALVIEDSPTGARAGVAAGCRVFIVPTGTDDVPEGAVKLSSFAELRALIAEARA